MSLNRVTLGVLILVAVAIGLITVPGLKSQIWQHNGNGIAVNPNAYYPLPPGKQTIRVNAAREACASQGSGAYLISQGVHLETYLPLPPGKATALIDSARRACVEAHLGARASK